MTFRTCTKWTAYVFAALAGLLFVSSVWIIHRSDRVLSWPIRLSADFRLQERVRVWRKADYRISVYCSPPAGQEHVEKLLQGGNLVQVAITESGTAVPLHFFPEPLFRPGIVSTDELGNIVMGKEEVGQDIADFTGDPAKDYTVICSTTRSVPEIDQMHPRLTIALDPLERKSDMGLIILLWISGAVSVIIALIAAVMYVAVRKRRGLTNSSP